MSSSVLGASTRAWLTSAHCDLADFVALVSQQTQKADYPLAADVVQNVVVYSAADVSATASTPEGRRDAQAEIVKALTAGPGIVVFKRAYPDLGVVDRATAAFNELIERQKASGAAAGDHFAKPGANDRVWNALEKLALHDPETFADYYANDVLDLISVAWLGPGYQVTSQVNVVNPGGQAQVAHRDYHLGFMSESRAAAYPAHLHRLTPALTLQGAVAHCDMPIETGPTLYLPYSHQYEPGYLAFHRPEFTAFFDEHYVQLPLEKGDAAFFNPALFHGAGTNRSSDVRRMANLLQVSCAFGRAMETVDRAAMCQSVFPTLRNRRATGAPEASLRNVVAATAEGYGFPTNLDLDQPIDGLAPETQAELLWRAVDGNWTDEEFGAELNAHEARRRSTL
ncbi:MAG TPA: phytanoyl-CoA dioxygenase family protein [Nocardioidaceae bacterium]|nr:phytanoyl-CoA dioxygenase family protein [Nocardioidaceae bacterium]